LLDYEQDFLSQGYGFVIGVDEAGRGPLAGPVVASACALRTSDVLQWENVPCRHPMSKLIRDSKTLSEKQREGLYDFILENFYVGVGICDHKTIDRMNILEATFLAMKKALTDLTRNVKKDMENNSRQKIFNFQFSIFNEFSMNKFSSINRNAVILVDGNKVIPNCSYEQKAIVNGDKLVKSISAASIAAKVTRDRMMREAHIKYPEYDFAKHKGYGTAAHMAALKKYGPCEIHRRSFAPVKACDMKRETN